MKLDDHLILLVAPVLHAVLMGERAADHELEAFFRRHRGLGSGERRLVSEGFYAALRHRRRLAAHAGEEGAAALLAALPWLESPAPPDMPPEIRHSLPDWLWSAWREERGEAGAEALAEAFNQPAPMDLRVDPRRCSRETLLAELVAAGAEARPTPYAPHGVRCFRRLPLGELPSFQKGGVEVQDEGSQLVSHLLAPPPEGVVVDLCAGAGGKSLHLAALLGRKGKVIASDADAARLSRLKPRLERAGYRNVELLPLRHEGDARLRPWTGKADAVLVDAPCSGSGTLRRHPELKGRLTPEGAAMEAMRQGALLAAGSRLVRLGGRLVYAVCSLLPQEGEAVVREFLAAESGWRLGDAGRALTAGGIPGLAEGDGFLRLDPARHGTDGFFAALLLRRA
ncbi:MAG: RsmB/NOP family class I SAM-dependent RNA methyltransferase [Magnetococcales bacterium]|nr:RsmB/NOP family class I SAM-dependent RNA methyltransferase [Magnetococcales bacterium]